MKSLNVCDVLTTQCLSKEEIKWLTHKGVRPRWRRHKPVKTLWDGWAWMI